MPYRSETDAPPLRSFCTIANAFSLVRVVLVVPTLWLMWLGPEYRWEALGLVVTMVLTDWLDGYFARSRGEITWLGKVLDPLADKLAIDSIAIAMVCLKGLPVWAAVAIVARDVLIVLAGSFLVSRERVVISANVWGKLTSAVVTALLLSYLLGWEALKGPLLVLGVLLLAVSLASYGMQFFWKSRAA